MARVRPVELRVGGAVELTFRHSQLSHEKEAPERYRGAEGHVSPGHVTRCDPPRMLSITWPADPRYSAAESEVTFELAEEGDKVRLVLTHRRLPNRAEMRNVAGGWHSHLATLEDRLAGREPRGFWSTHAEVEKEYARLIPD